MNEKDTYENKYNMPYGDYLSSVNAELRTKKNIEAIESLFGEWDDDDKNNTAEFNLNEQASITSNLDFGESKSSFNEPSDSLNLDDPLEKTMEIDNVDIEEVKNLLNELHELYDEPKEEISENTAQNQSKGKSLVKATKQGIAFSNGSMTRTFLDCTILCFITASMGFGMLMYIFSQI